MKPKVSIIVPVYKTENTLRECVNSLINQRLKEIEIILVDDGTPDEAGSICDEYLTDSRVKVIHKKNGGLSSARNAGLEVATGNYIGFVDSDDYVSVDMFDRLYKQIDATDADVCVCAHYTVAPKGEESQHLFSRIPDVLEEHDILEKLILPLIGPDAKDKTAMEGFVCRNLYKKTILKNHRFISEREIFAEDVAFNLSVYRDCKKICILNESLYYYRYNPESLSNDYRQNVSVMLEKLLQWEKTYMIDINIDRVEYGRLYATGVKFVLFSIRNLKKQNCTLSKKEKIDEIKKILNQDMFSQSIKKSHTMIHNYKMRIFVLLCRCRACELLLKLV